MPSDDAHTSTNRLRIVVPRYGEQIVGGSETLARRLATALSIRQWEIDVFTTTALEEATWANALTPGVTHEDGVRVHRFPTAFPRSPFLFHQLSRVFFRLPSSLRPELPWLLAQGPVAPGLVRALRATDAVPTLFIPYLFYPTLFGLPATRRPRLMIPAGHDERPFYLRRVGRTMALADALLYSTPEERALVESVYPAAAARPAEVGTVGVEAPPADGERFRHRHGLTRPYLLYGGRMGSSKRFDELMEGMRRLREVSPDAALVLMGEAGEATPPQPGIVPVGRLDEQERWDAIAGAAGVVSPSYFESLSLLVLEAWALGRPCLVNRASPVLAGQSERSGGAVAYLGADELAAGGRKLLEDVRFGDRLGAAGRSYVDQHYRWDDVARRISSLIDRVA
ncbi:MAG TPA: glycosyltransferase family 4 protein [Candidatus Sulfotelmatobacter sp.]|nr:glycosyltransferase family 4 protein [Candidatus Sulfotelmatobacter sp.]